MPETGARSILLGPATEGVSPVVVVPPGELQAVKSCGEYILSACFVAPGFDFADFSMPSREELLREHPVSHRISGRGERFRPGKENRSGSRTCGFAYNYPWNGSGPKIPFTIEGVVHALLRRPDCLLPPRLASRVGGADIAHHGCNGPVFRHRPRHRRSPPFLPSGPCRSLARRKPASLVIVLPVRPVGDRLPRGDRRSPARRRDDPKRIEEAAPAWGFPPALRDRRAGADRQRNPEESLGASAPPADHRIRRAAAVRPSPPSSRDARQVLSLRPLFRGVSLCRRMVGVGPASPPAGRRVPRGRPDDRLAARLRAHGGGRTFPVGCRLVGGDRHWRCPHPLLLRATDPGARGLARVPGPLDRAPPPPGNRDDAP